MAGLQVHLIVRHKNPKGEIEEKHLKNPPSVPSDDRTHVYTAILRASNNRRASTRARRPWASIGWLGW